MEGWVGNGDECNKLGEDGDIGRGDAARREVGWGDDDERISLGDVGGMGKGDAARREDE